MLDMTRKINEYTMPRNAHNMLYGMHRIQAYVSTVDAFTRHVPIRATLVCTEKPIFVSKFNQVWNVIRLFQII